MKNDTAVLEEVAGLLLSHREGCTSTVPMPWASCCRIESGPVVEAMMLLEAWRRDRDGTT